MECKWLTKYSNYVNKSSLQFCELVDVSVKHRANFEKRLDVTQLLWIMKNRNTRAVWWQDVWKFVEIRLPMHQLRNSHKVLSLKVTERFKERVLVVDMQNSWQKVQPDFPSVAYLYTSDIKLFFQLNKDGAKVSVSLRTAGVIQHSCMSRRTYRWVDNCRYFISVFLCHISADLWVATCCLGFCC